MIELVLFADVLRVYRVVMEGEIRDVLNAAGLIMFKNCQTRMIHKKKNRCTVKTT